MTREDMLNAIDIALTDKIKINAHIKGDEIPLPEITEDTVIRDLDLDSLDLVEMIMDVEDKLDIEIDDEEITECITVGDLLTLAESKESKL